MDFFNAPDLKTAINTAKDEDLREFLEKNETACPAERSQMEKAVLKCVRDRRKTRYVPSGHDETLSGQDTSGVNLGE